MRQLFATAALFALVAGCASLNSPSEDTTDASIALEMTSNVLVFRDVGVETAPEGASLVTGTLRRIGHRPVRAGHIDYRLTDADGRVLEQGQASDGGATGHSHPGQRSRFAIPLQAPWIPGQHRLYLKWHAAAHAGSPA